MAPSDHMAVIARHDDVAHPPGPHFAAADDERDLHDLTGHSFQFTLKPIAAGRTRRKVIGRLVHRHLKPEHAVVHFNLLLARLVE
jgi:hypothetical protein